MRCSKLWIGLTLLLSSALLSACNCDCEPATEFQLPTLGASVSQSVRVLFRRGQDAEPQIVCEWGEPTAGAAALWSCTPTANSVGVDSGSSSLSRFTYKIADVTSAWSIELQGPSGSQVVSRFPRDTDPGEGYPGECVCYSHDVTVEVADLRAVGATLP